jgi:hypothetical protein
MPVAGKLSHVDAKFDDQHLGGALSDAMDGIEARQLLGERTDEFLDALVQGRIP